MAKRNRSPVRRLRKLEQDRLLAVVNSLPYNEADLVDRAWEEWAHPGQEPPEGDWRTWVIMGGRGFGKTRAGSEWVMANVEAFGPVRIALVAASIDEARRVMIEGESGLIRVGAPLVRRWFSTEGRIVFNSGAEAQIYSGASPDRLRGPEHHFAWCDELSKWRQAEKSWDMLQLGLRLGEKPRAVITTTPRPGPALERIMADPKVVTTGGTTRANPHLPPSFVRAVHAMYGGTRLGRQELDGEMLTDAPGALWTVETLEKSRLRGARPGQFERVAVGVDPPSGDGTCGIVVCARDRDGVGHVLADHSVAGVSPDAWARTVAGAAAIHRAELIVAERNQGGRMVGHVLQVADPGARVKLVNATQGKCVRAEPIGLLFEAGRIRIHGEFPELEAQLKGMIAGGGYEGPGTSPDRADAMIWALIELMLGHGAKPELRSI